MYFFHVLINNVKTSIKFTYKYHEKISIGTRVVVEFINKTVIGFIWENIPLSSVDYDINKIKSILLVFKETVPKDIIYLIKFISNYYHYPLNLTFFVVQPAKLKKVSSYEIDEHLYVCLSDTDQISKFKKNKHHLKVYNFLLKNRIVKICDIKDIIGITYKRIIKRWIEEGVICYYDNKLNELNQFEVRNKVILNNEQINAINTISSYFYSFKSIILYGVTGSGKTEVYLNLIELAILDQKQVLVLVPEINLTPQLLERFKNRFLNVRLAVITSNINEGDRYIYYKETMDGYNQIVVGTRMAVFTPFNNLGLIIVDEEHDYSFKQNDTLRYNARDVAVFRAKYYNIPIVLGSATPSLETLYNYKLNKYMLCKLTSRASQLSQLPVIKLIDLNLCSLKSNIFSDMALDAITDRLSKKEISLIYINRRGYAPLIRCYDCGFIPKCKNCSSVLVYHSTDMLLKCHHCNFNILLFKQCVMCGSQNLQAIGHGTQQVENFLKTQYPTAHIIRVDQDVINNISDWQNLHNLIKNNEVDIIIGTQMLSKSHDFHAITLVIGLNLDSGLYSYDFRATEFLFAQLLQVSGRAGRGDKKGEVILQTYYPNHFLYQYLINNDFIGFANYLLKERSKNLLPPYTYYAVLRASAKKITDVLVFLESIYNKMSIYAKMDDIVKILAPVPMHMYRLKNKERGQILLLSKNRTKLHAFVNNMNYIILQLKTNNKINWYFDIDPLDVY